MGNDKRIVFSLYNIKKHEKFGPYLNSVALMECLGGNPTNGNVDCFNRMGMLIDVNLLLNISNSTVGCFDS